MAKILDKKLISACGMNCNLCLAYLRKTNKCPGCNSGKLTKKSRLFCKIRLCTERSGNFCFDCEKFPCKLVIHLDERYRARFGMSMVENLKNIKENGLNKFIDAEEQKWVNDEGIFCVHDKNRYKVE